MKERPVWVVKPLLMATCLALLAGGCGSSDEDSQVNSDAPAGAVESTTIPGCVTTTTLNTGEEDDPWRGTAPPWVPRGEGDLPVEPPPTLPEDEAVPAAQAAAADRRIGPVLADAELIKTFPWNVYAQPGAVATSSVGALLYYRLSEPTDVPLDWGQPATGGGESGWLLGDDGLPVLEPSGRSVFRAASVVAVYVLGSERVYLVIPYDYMPLQAC